MARASTLLAILALLLAPALASAAAYDDEGGGGDAPAEEPAEEPAGEAEAEGKGSEPAPAAEPAPVTPASQAPNRAMVIITDHANIEPRKSTRMMSLPLRPDSLHANERPVASGTRYAKVSSRFGIGSPRGSPAADAG